jgi:hypothetical protein
VALRKYSKHLPWALPAIVFLFDFVDMQWMFSHEPGLSEEVVTRFQLLLLPGLEGQLKTGQLGSLQNRPTGVAQDVILIYPAFS